MPADSESGRFITKQKNKKGAQAPNKREKNKRKK